MSDLYNPSDWPPEEHDDLLAAEYVLGVLPGEERQAAAQRAELDGAFAAMIAGWERRLALLNAAYEEGPVSAALYPRIEAALFGSPSDMPATAPRGGFWRLWLGGLVAAAVVAMAVLFWTPQTQAPLVAQLQSGELAFNASFERGVLSVAHTGPAAEDNQDYELWAIGADGVPQSLGVLRGPSQEIPAELTEGITLAVSLEPLGGSPAEGPTGPVLMAGELIRN